jgi:hypothetical protein
MSNVRPHKMHPVENIGSRLGVLASFAAQERFMVNATSEEYLLPVEAINDAYAVVQEFGANGLNGLEAQSHVFEAVRRFALILEAESEHIDALLELQWSELVHGNASWAALREAAGACLSSIGFDLTQWERSEGYAA